MASSDPIAAKDLAAEVAKGAEVRAPRSAEAAPAPAAAGSATSFKCEKKSKAPSNEVHITSITDETIILKRSIPFHRDTVNLRTKDVSLCRVTTADISVSQLIRTAWKPTLFAIVLLVVGDKSDPKIPKMIGLGSVMLVLCIAYVVMKHLGVVVEFEGDTSAFGYVPLPKSMAAVANNWANIPPKERRPIVDAFVQAKTAGKADTGKEDVSIKSTSHIAGRIITNTCEIIVGQHHVRIVNKGGYLTPCGRPTMTEEMAFATDDIRYINCVAGEHGGPIKVALFFFLIGFAIDAGNGDNGTNALVGAVLALIVYIALSMRSGAPVEFGLKGGAYAVGQIDSMKGRRALTDLINARQMQRELSAERPSKALQTWKGTKPGKKDEEGKGYDLLELHTDCMEMNTYEDGKCACMSCCVGEVISWNIALKHAHSIQTSYQGFAHFLYLAILFFIIWIVIMFVVDVDLEVWQQFVPLLLAILCGLAFHFTKICQIFIGTNEVDSNQMQPPLAITFKGTEASLETMVAAVRNQQSLNDNGDTSSGGGGGQIVGLVPAASEA